MLSRFLIIVIASSFLSAGYANDQVVTLKKSERAPFSGTLFSTSAAANIVIELENKNIECKLKISEAVGKQRALDKFQLDLKQASLDSCTEKYAVITELKQGQIDNLTEQLKKNTGPQPVWWFSAGIVGGVLISLGTAYAYSQVSSSNSH
jgi:hypothetical protein